MSMERGRGEVALVMGWVRKDVACTSWHVCGQAAAQAVWPGCCEGMGPAQRLSVHLSCWAADILRSCDTPSVKRVAAEEGKLP